MNFDLVVSRLSSDSATRLHITPVLRFIASSENCNDSWHTTVGLCKSSFLRLEYSVELLIEYSSTRPIPEVAINYRVAQNERPPGSSFKFVIQQRCEMSQYSARNA